MTTRIVGKTRSVLRDFLRSEAAGGIILIFAAALAMIVANFSEPVSNAYFEFLHAELGPDLGHGPMTIHLWINDGLMAIFFLLVGLEIKREFVDGRLSSWEHRRLPVVAAIAGMVVPAVIYLSIVDGEGAGLSSGWAIPAATDIAFAIGVLAILGKHAPTSLKLFLTTVAIVDDMGAVAIIALAYTEHINTLALALGALVMATMYVLNRQQVKTLWIYLLLAAALWYFVFLSGIHATIAGVLAAMMIPITRSPGHPDDVTSPLHRLEHAITPWSAYLIVPLFGFANAGVSLAGLSPAVLFDPVPLAIAAGLFFGKQIGIFGSVWISHATRFAPAPSGTTWPQVYGMSLLAGIGFTMSLFIGGLAFPGNALLIDEVKIGVLVGSILSALGGYAVLRFSPGKVRARRVVA